MNTEEINHIIKAINKALKEEDIDFTAVIILDQDIENLIIGEG
jgi:predicted transcriptional regulator